MLPLRRHRVKLKYSSKTLQRSRILPPPSLTHARLCHLLQRRKSSLITTRRQFHSTTFVAQFLCPLVSVSVSVPFSHPTFLSFSLPPPSDRLPCLYPVLLSSMRSTSSAASVPTAGRSYQPLDFGDDADEQHRAINTFDHVSLIASRLWRCARPLINRCVSEHR
jgi:hypothetical protein